MADREEIHVLDHKVRLLQPPGGFRTSLDSIMLAAACPAEPGDRVLDMGCGVGGASFSLLWRVAGCLVTGIEKHPDYIDCAIKNGALNNNSERCEFILSDIRDYKISSPDQRFDHIICNPPYFEDGHHTPSPDEARAIALGHLDEDISLENWIDCGFHLLKPNGSLVFIHKANVIDKLIQHLGRRFGAVEIIPLWPRTGVAAKRVIVRARKDRRTPATVHAGLTLHNPDGSYTEAAEKILRQGEALLPADDATRPK